MAAEQQRCGESLQLAASPSLQVQKSQVRGVELLCDVSTAVVRPIVPAACRREVFAAMHYLAHPGIRATRRMVTRRFIWKGCGADVARWCRDCQECQRGKMTRQPAAVVQPIPVPHRRFSHLHVDLVGPLPTLPEGFEYIFTVIDRSTRWLEAVPVKNLEATTAADALVESWISRFGVPADITSDRGTQFTSQVWAKLCNKLGIRHHMTTAYHPASNGLVE
jgi:transposase InsO family protein